MCIFWFNKVCKKYPDNAAGLDQVSELCVWCDDGVGYDGQTEWGNSWAGEMLLHPIIGPGFKDMLPSDL